MFEFLRRKKGLVNLDNLYFPRDKFDWVAPWWNLEKNPDLRLGIQKELHSELSSKHPLWGLEPVIVMQMTILLFT